MGLVDLSTDLKDEGTLIIPTNIFISSPLIRNLAMEMGIFISHKNMITTCRFRVNLLSVTGNIVILSAGYPVGCMLSESIEIQ